MKHLTSPNMKESVRQSVEAGLNVRCTFRSPDSYILPVRELVREGAISMETIDERVRDILRVKFMVGLFDKPYVSEQEMKRADIEVNGTENNKVALEASQKSLVLLKNNGFATNFEWVLGMYSYPQYGRFDPTFIMSIFYFVIFGIMIECFYSEKA